MRILHLVPNLNYGGLQKIVLLLALHQRRAGHTVTIASWSNFHNHPEAERQLEEAGVKVVYPRREPDGAVTQSKKKLILRLKALMGTGGAGILHVHNPFHYYLFGAIAARVAGHTKTIETVHATVMFDYPGYGSRGRRKFRIAAMLSHGLVSVSDESGAFLRKRFFLPGKKFFVVRNGIDMTPFLAVPVRAPSELIVIGTAGRMSFEKNHKVLIDAFLRVYRRHDNVRLRILGGGKLEAELRAKVQDLGLDDVVDFCGYSNDVPTFLSGLDVFALTSDSEALPLSLIEAIASGIPAVATSVGGVPSVIQNTSGGWLCEPNNADSIAAAIESAIGSLSATGDVGFERDARTRRAREIAASLYSAERMAADYEVVYKKLLGRALQPEQQTQ
ncbi:MAG TPA: glycosyltransferase [Acidisarcina sp.]